MTNFKEGDYVLVYYRHIGRIKKIHISHNEKEQSSYTVIPIFSLQYELSNHKSRGDNFNQPFAWFALTHIDVLQLLKTKERFDEAIIEVARNKSEI